jgi:glycosyltransferase involved in cell wall biosynthesis
MSHSLAIAPRERARAVPTLSARTSAAPELVVLVPLYAHSVLVADALLSALQQRCPYPCVVLVVNDGCRFAESHRTVKAIVAAHPLQMRYILQPNAGLSAARNAGIEYALAQFPSMRAIYFLDADNVIRPNALAGAYQQLLENSAASWVYPNIDMFGIRRNFDYGGSYSLLKHTKYNICEAGSLVHRRVFDAGVRFDESMRLGYEDWDFWLSAARHGFHGVHFRHFGFRYRNRGESMLSQSKRDGAEILAYMQNKHVGILGKRSLQRLEAQTTPRYAVHLIDTHETVVGTDLNRGATTVPSSEFDELMWRNIVIPQWQAVPPFAVFTTRALFDELLRTGLIQWALFDCERRLRSMNFASLSIARAGAATFAVADGGSVRDCALLMLSRDVLCATIVDEHTSWIEQLLLAPEQMKVTSRVLTLPEEARSQVLTSGFIVYSLLMKIIAWRSSSYCPAVRHNWIWRGASIPPSHTLTNVVRDAFAGEVAYPGSSVAGHEIGFVISIGSFGGVERVAYNVAREFAAAGWRVHVFLVGRSRLQLAQEFLAVIASINFIEGEEFCAWDATSEYQGTALPALENGAARVVDQLVAALSWLDVVINCHCGALNAAAAPLRKLGVKTLTHLHLLDHSPLGRSVGHPMLTLAYEYAYDLIICNSLQLRSWMHAAGIPAAKLLYVPNAPGHSLSAAQRAAISARRDTPADPALKVLYLGRLDRQKGIDRLAALIERAEQMKLPITWRVLGGAVTNDYVAPATLAPFIEPPVFESHALVEVYEWADVLVLLSDFEGVPLSVLEAQRAGVIVLATKVGALSEIVDDGNTGFLVELDSAVDQALAVLCSLIASTDLRRRISSAGASARTDGWPQATAELIERVTALTRPPGKL